MTRHLFDTLPWWAMLAVLAVHVAVGIAAGWLYFRGLWWNTRLFASGAPAAKVIALVLGRFVLLAAVLVPVALEGALPLAATALGTFAARSAVLRKVRREENFA